MNSIQTVKTVNQIIKLYEHIVTEGFSPIVFCDIDDTVLASSIGIKFVDPKICQFIDLVYSSNPDNLVFLTAREPNLKKHTINQLNRSGLLKKGKYIFYNVIHAPYSNNGLATKGEVMVSYLDLNPSKTYDWVIFIDDSYEQIESVYKHIQNLKNIKGWILLYFKP